VPIFQAASIRCIPRPAKARASTCHGGWRTVAAH